MTWNNILGQWLLVEADFQQFYGIDVETPGLLKSRSSRWLRSKITGLLWVDTSRIARHLKHQRGD